MKKAMVILLLFSFVFGTLPAYAEEYYTIREVREQAAGGWHQRYTAHGREVTVDIDVVVPDVDSMPVQRVEFARLTPSFTEEETGWRIVCREEENVFVYETQVYPEEVSDKIKKVAEGVYANPNEFDRAYPSGTDLTLGEAIGIARDSFILAGLDPDEYLLDRPYELRTFGFYDVKTNEAVLGEYYLSFYQQLNGIPILCHSGVAYRERYPLYYNPRLAAITTGKDAYAIFVDKVKPSATIAEDVPLCAASKIIRSIENEIKDGHIRKVYELELGYILYDDPEYISDTGMTGHYYAVPAWRLNCLYLSSAKKELPDYEGTDVFERDTTEFASILINAQSGKMQEYRSDEKGKGIYQGFISWKDIPKK